MSRRNGVIKERLKRCLKSKLIIIKIVSQGFAFGWITMWQQTLWQFFLFSISISVVKAEIENEREGKGTILQSQT